MKYILIIILFTLTCCSKENIDTTIKPTNNTEKPVVKIKEEKDELITGICLTKRLKIRDKPYLESIQIGSLIEDQEVTIIRKTEWKDSIDGLNEYWYQIIYEDTTGWVYGGYISPSDTNIQNNYIYKQIIETKFINNVKIDISTFSDFFVRAFSETPSQIYDSPEKMRIELNWNLLDILNPIIPKDKITINITTPEGIAFKKEIITEKVDHYLLHQDYQTSTMLKYPILSIPFFPHATYQDGEWMFQVLFDKEKEINQIITIKPNTLSLSKTLAPNPFEDFSKIIIGKDEDCFISIQVPEKNREFYIVLFYHFEDGPGGANYKPVLATQSNTNEYGILNTNFRFGNDLEFGDYRIGFGIDEANIKFPSFNNEIIYR